MSQTNESPYFFSGYISPDGKIFSNSFSGDQHVGVVLRVYNALQKQFDDLKDTFNEYQKRLIELGEIEVPLSPDEVVKKQAEQLGQMQQMLLQTQQAMVHMQQQLEVFVGGGHGHNGNHIADSRKQSEVARHDGGSGEDSAQHIKDAELAAGTDEVRPPKQRKAK